MYEGPFDSDEASDGLWELERREDVAVAMVEALGEFVAENQEYVEEGYGEESLAISCLVAARISGIAPDEVAHHWLDRNPFVVDDELRGLAAAAFALTTRAEDNYLAEGWEPEDWREFVASLEPYRKALHGEPQDVPEPFVPDYADPHRPWLTAHWSDGQGGLSRNTVYRRRIEQAVEAVNESAVWRGWWQRSGLQELTLFGHLGSGPRDERVSRGRMTAEVWLGFDHSHELGDATVAQATADLLVGLSRIGDHLRLGALPELEQGAAQRWRPSGMY